MSRENNPLIVAKEIIEILPDQDINLITDICKALLSIDGVHGLIPFNMSNSICTMRIEFQNDIVTNGCHYISEERMRVDFSSGEDLVFSLLEIYQGCKIESLVMESINQKLAGNRGIPEVEYLVKLAEKHRNILLMMFLNTADVYNKYRRNKQ